MKSEPPSDSLGQLCTILESISEEAKCPSGGTELGLIELDPHRAFVYWNIDPADADVSRSPVLRVYDITVSGDVAGAEQAYDVEVQGLQGRWYVDFWRDDRTFVAEIGYRQPDGSLDVLARSNQVHTPPAHPHADEAVVEHVDPLGRPLRTELPAAVTPPPADEPTLPVIEPIKLLDPNFPVAEWMEAQLVQQEEPDDVSPAMDAAGEAAVAFNDESEVEDIQLQVFPDADRLKEFVAENHDAVQAFYDAVEAMPPPSATGEHVAAPVEEPMPERAGPSAPVATSPQKSFALEHFIGCSSLEFAGRNSELEVHAELHIYGRAEPGARLTLYGQTITTQPDGTFSIRRPIPAGSMVIPLLKV